MGHGATPTFFQRQTRLSTIKGLHLRFLVHAQHQCLVGRIKIDPDDVGELFHEPFVSGKLEAPYAMRLQTVRPPYLSHHVMTDALSFSHSARTPVGCICRHGVELSSNLRVGKSLGRKQAYPRSKHHTLRRCFAADPCPQLASLLATHLQGFSFVSHGTAVKQPDRYVKLL